MSTEIPYLLAIESSCDDTSAAVLQGDKVLSNVIASQKIHQEYGGVVPELASRAHQQHIVPVVHQALQRAGVGKEQLSAIGFTRGPGLQGSLLVGVSFAKSLALSLGIPLVEVNHLQGHILSHFIDEGQKKPAFPFLAMTISGGHTQILKVNDYFSMEILGETQDDATGEAFDKTAKLLGLPYPGGPLIDQYAQKGNPKAFPFPFPKVEGLNFSFSGLKTAVLYFIGYMCLRAIYHHRNPDAQAQKSCRADMHPPNCHRRRSLRQFWLAANPPTVCPKIPLGGLPPLLPVLYRQCCYDRYCCLFQVLTKGLCRYAHHRSSKIPF